MLVACSCLTRRTTSSGSAVPDEIADVPQGFAALLVGVPEHRPSGGQVSMDIPSRQIFIMIFDDG
jgi:hypothetical protein